MTDQAQALRQQILDLTLQFHAEAFPEREFVPGVSTVPVSGKVIDGDHVLLIAARSLKSHGLLRGDTVVATVMSNLGLERALDALGIRMLRTPVGDKYVLEEMIRQDASIGGEQSGHVIFREFSTTGDGMLTALRVFEIAEAAGMNLDQLTEDFIVYPQKLVNIRVKQRRPMHDLPLTLKAIAEAERELNGSGRVLVRFSGTELLARVMVEGPDLASVDRHSSEIAQVIKEELK